MDFNNFPDKFILLEYFKANWTEYGINLVGTQFELVYPLSSGYAIDAATDKNFL